MQYHRKPNVLILLALVGMGVAASGPARGDTIDQAGGAYFKGPTAVCLSRTTLVYPCVSLSPPAYQSSLGAGIMSSTGAPDLPLDSGASRDNWLERIKNGQYWSEWHVSRRLQGMGMNFSLNRAGASVNMDLGPLKFNVFAEDGDISASRFFLGISRSW